jgi:hypothetical protein
LVSSGRASTVSTISLTLCACSIAGWAPPRIEGCASAAPAAASRAILLTATERRASASLASIFALRMLGLFLVLPVFALEAARYPGGDDPALVGLAMGIYGLTQGLLQIPFGMASDRLGPQEGDRAGLLVFAAGSFAPGRADARHWLIAGRALQGAGAVSAAVTALLADQTRDEVRTKAMALVGASIGLMFALSLVAAPLLAALHRPARPVRLTGALALAGIAVVVWWTPPEPVEHKRPRGSLADVLKPPPCCGWTSACSCCMRCSWPCGWRAGAAGAGRPAKEQPLAGLPAGGAGCRSS